ncbi:hypothetical protein BDD12DRAFT_536720 [Trichophaea hybrida]|nr:hypothetical protein BDD12DRAFT_536720 [Trichophaea hybrida]
MSLQGTALGDVYGFDALYSRHQSRIQQILRHAAQDLFQYAPYDDSTLYQLIQYGAQDFQQSQQNQQMVGCVEPQLLIQDDLYRPIDEPLPVLSYEPTGQEVLAQRIDYLENIIDGTNSVAGSGTRSAVGSESQSQEQQPQHSRNPKKRCSDRSTHTSNPSAGDICNFEPRIDVPGSRSLPPHPSDRQASNPQRRTAVTPTHGDHLVPSQPQQLSVSGGSCGNSELDHFLRSQPSWVNREGLSSFTSVPLSPAARTMPPPSVTHSIHRSPLDRKHKGKRTRPAITHPPPESVAGTDTVSMAGSDRTCHECHTEFPFPRDLKIHVVAKHNGGVQCNICHESLSTEYSRKRHLATKHNNGIPCTYQDCSSVLGTESALKSHLAKEHKHGRKCQICGKILATNKYDKHMSDAHNQGPFPCICGKRLTSDSNLRVHRQKCSGVPTSHGHPSQGRHHHRSEPAQ